MNSLWPDYTKEEKQFVFDLHKKGNSVMDIVRLHNKNKKFPKRSYCSVQHQMMYSGLKSTVRGTKNKKILFLFRKGLKCREILCVLPEVSLSYIYDIYATFNAEKRRQIEKRK